MHVEVSPKAAKYLELLSDPIKQRIKNVLRNLAQDPLKGDIKPLSGKDGYRMRVGQYRLIFDITDNNIIVYEIGPRGQIYKGGA